MSYPGIPAMRPPPGRFQPPQASQQYNGYGAPPPARQFPQQQPLRQPPAPQQQYQAPLRQPFSPQGSGMSPHGGLSQRFPPAQSQPQSSASSLQQHSQQQQQQATTQYTAPGRPFCFLAALIASQAPRVPARRSDADVGRRQDWGMHLPSTNHSQHCSSVTQSDYRVLLLCDTRVSSHFSSHFPSRVFSLVSLAHFCTLVFSSLFPLTSNSFLLLGW